MIASRSFCVSRWIGSQVVLRSVHLQSDRRKLHCCNLKNRNHTRRVRITVDTFAMRRRLRSYRRCGAYSEEPMQRGVADRTGTVAILDRIGARSLSVAGSRGFTLVEMIVTLIIIGVLAVVALPRLNTRVFDTTGFYQEVLSSVRYAQKEAIAKRRFVCVTLVAGSATISYKATSTPTFPLTCDTDLVSPRGVSPFVVTAKTGVSLSPASTFVFDALGRPRTTSNGALGSLTISISGTGPGDVAKSFVVESETGYVH